MDELRRKGGEERIGFELPNTGAATDAGAQMKRWRRIADIDDEEW